jgi:hypothetical protein
MNPALADRVRASIRQGGARRSGVDRRWRAAFRFAALAGITFALIALSVLRKQEDDQLEQARKSLLESVTLQRAQLSDQDMQTLDRAVTVLLRAPGPYEGDRMASEARGSDALTAILERPILYVRGPVDAFKGEEGLRRAALLSYPEAFVHCLVNPPRVRAEKALMERVRGGADPTASPPTSQVHRLYDLLAGLPLLQAPWKARVKEATEMRVLSQLEHELHAAKLDETAAAARARLVLFVMDEPSGSGGTTELDGERPHDVRVALFDLEQAKPLLRIRRHMDPSGFSDRGRAAHASGLDSCALSFDVREAVAKGDALTEVTH